MEIEINFIDLIPNPLHDYYQPAISRVLISLSKLLSQFSSSLGVCFDGAGSANGYEGECRDRRHVYSNVDKNSLHVRESNQRMGRRQSSAAFGFIILLRIIISITYVGGGEHICKLQDLMGFDSDYCMCGSLK